MFNPFAKLFCATALASTALAASLSIAAPAPGTAVTAGSSFNVELQKVASSTTSKEVSIAIATMPCPAGCPDPSQTLGTVLYSGSLGGLSTDAAGASYQNFTLTMPNWYNGLVQVTVADFYLDGAYASPHLEFTTATVNVVGGSG